VDFKFTVYFFQFIEFKFCFPGNVDYLDSNTSDNSADSLAKFPFKALGGRIKTAGNSIKSSAGNAAAGLLASSSQVAGLAIKNPPKKTRPKNPPKKPT
jgi:hypothetical protein